MCVPSFVYLVLRNGARVPQDDDVIRPGSSSDLTGFYRVFFFCNRPTCFFFSFVAPVEPAPRRRFGVFFGIFTEFDWFFFCLWAEPAAVWLRSSRVSSDRRERIFNAALLRRFSFFFFVFFFGYSSEIGCRPRFPVGVGRAVFIEEKKKFQNSNRQPDDDDDRSFSQQQQQQQQHRRKTRSVSRSQPDGPRTVEQTAA